MKTAAALKSAQKRLMLGCLAACVSIGCGLSPNIDLPSFDDSKDDGDSSAEGADDGVSIDDDPNGEVSGCTSLGGQGGEGSETSPTDSGGACGQTAAE